MRLAMNPRASRLLGRLPRPTVYSALELLLLALIAVQAARLFWTLVTPVGPIGEWKGTAASGALPGGDSVLTEFDPFFRLAGAAGPATVTSLNLKLYGVREDRATGRGSAIIALPDGSQLSFAVGDEVMPGVRLAEVGFDSVTIERGGVREQIFLDQSEPAEAPAPVGVEESAAPAAPVSAVPAAPQAADAGQGGAAVPNDRTAAALRSAGFRSGDVLLSVNGQRAASPEEALAILRQSGGQADIIVNRNGRNVPLRIRLPQ